MKFFNLICLLIFLSPLAFAENYGVFMIVKGDVKITSAKDRTQTPAKIGMKVFPGDSIISAADSRAKIVMSDRNVINVNPDTKFVIEKYVNDSTSGKKDVKINLLQGKIRTNVEEKYDGEKNKFEIKTPTAVAGVRGTRFLVDYSPSTGISQVFTFHGAVTFVTVNPNGSFFTVSVKQGETSIAEPGKPPQPPLAVPPEKMKQLDNESQAEVRKSDSVTNPSTTKTTTTEKKEDGTTAVNERPTKPPASDSSMLDSKDLNATNMGNQINTEMDRVGNQRPPPPPQFDSRNNIALPPPPPDLVKDIISNNNSTTKVIVVPVQK